MVIIYDIDIFLMEHDTTISYESFSSKYKPTKLTEFGMDSDLYNVLVTLINMNKLKILFYGDSGSGKTTLTTTIIKEYYNLSKFDLMPIHNIIYINNIKEFGIGFFRDEMKIFCQSKCSIPGKKKMIIIDDLDNINEQSQQVLRDYIDKYNNNIHFIFVCTNLQKVSECIQSRVLILNVKPLSIHQINIFMNQIMLQENIILTDEEKQYLLSVCNGSIKNIINYLEKINLFTQSIDINGKLTKKLIDINICKQICSNISYTYFDDYLICLREHKLHNAILILYNIYDNGYSVIDILDYFFTYLKTNNNLDDQIKYFIVPFICKYINIFINLHENKIELALFTNNIYKQFIT